MSLRMTNRSARRESHRDTANHRAGGPGPVAADVQTPQAVRLAAFVALAYLTLAAMPRVPFYITTGVDAAWNYALNLIRQDGLRFGPDVTYTFGPLGYLTVPDPELTPWREALAFRLLGWAALVWGLWSLALAKRLWLAVLASAILVSQALLSIHYTDSWQAGYVAALLAAAVAPSTAGFLVSGVVVGITLLVKTNEAAAALGAFVLLLAAHGRSRPRAALCAATVPVLLLAAGCQAWNGGTWTALPYIRWALEVAKGYTEASSLPGPRWQLVLILGFGAIPFLIVLAYSRGRHLLHPVFWAAALIAFQSFKHSVVRQDGHADLALLKLSAAILFLWPLLPRPSLRLAAAAWMLAGAEFTWWYVSGANPWIFQTAKQSLTPAGMAENVGRLVEFPEKYAEAGRYSRGTRGQLALSPSFRSRVGSGTVDAFPDAIDWIRANGWRYRPRPTIQALTAFTRSLTLRNLVHMESDRAADFMLLVFDTVDGRHPFLQDAGTLRAMLERYEPVEQSAEALLLERRRQWRRLELREAGVLRVRWGEAFSIPPPGPREAIWASFEIRPSVWGRLRWFLFRTSPPVIYLVSATGETFAHRLLRDVAMEPMPLRPLPRNPAQAAMYFRGEDLPKAAEPTGGFLATEGLHEYEPEILIRWHRVRRPAGGGSVTQPE